LDLINQFLAIQKRLLCTLTW